MRDYFITVDETDSYLMHYGRKGMKWGEHVYSREDIRNLKKFMRTKHANEYKRNFNKWDRQRFAEVGYRQGLFNNYITKGSKLSRYTSDDEKKLRQRAYMSIKKSPDDEEYRDMALRNVLGSSKNRVYNDTYTNDKTIRVAKAKRVANDLIKKYGDKELKERWKMYKDLNVHEKSGYIYDYADETYGKVAKTGKLSRDTIKNAEAMYDFKRQMGHDFNDMLYKNGNARDYIDKKYGKKYKVIEDAEDWVYGVSHPVIAYNGSDYLKRKNHRKIRD